MCFNSMNNNNAAYTSQYTKYSTLTLYTTSLRTLAVYFKESQNMNSMFLKSFLIFSKFKVLKLFLYHFVLLFLCSEFSLFRREFSSFCFSFLHFCCEFSLFCCKFSLFSRELSLFCCSFFYFAVSFLHFALVFFILLRVFFILL